MAFLVVAFLVEALKDNQLRKVAVGLLDKAVVLQKAVQLLDKAGNLRMVDLAVNRIENSRKLSQNCQLCC